jgi:hypothetical protein
MDRGHVIRQFFKPASDSNESAAQGPEGRIENYQTEKAEANS